MANSRIRNEQLNIADGWIPSTLTWSASDANTISIASTDLTGILQKGDKLKLTNDSAVKYYVITTTPAFSTNTTFDVTGETDLVSGAITLPYYSKMDNPQGMKNWRNEFKASAYAGSGQSVAANTPEVIEAGTEHYDLNSNYDTGTYKYIAPVSGYYRVGARVKGNNFGDNTRLQIYAQIGSRAYSGDDIQATGTGSYIACGVNALGYCAKGGEIYCNVSATASSSLQYDDSSSIWQQFEFVSI
jgi:hypothetical protein